MKHAESSTLIELNPEFAKKLESNGFDVFCSSFEDFESDENYDLILCSHVLYHIDYDKWLSWIKKMILLKYLNMTIKTANRNMQYFKTKKYYLDHF